MASIRPVSNPSQALITPGWPMASVPSSNPVADTEAKATVTAPATAPVLGASHKTALTQSGHVIDRID